MFYEKSAQWDGGKISFEYTVQHSLASREISAKQWPIDHIAVHQVKVGAGGWQRTKMNHRLSAQLKVGAGGTAG
jgi:hypothetical protein